MRIKKGLVTSIKMDKTVVVSVESYITHPKYKKRYKKTTKFYAHDPENNCVEGDVVVISETNPISKLKRWKIEEKI